jgi:hypothetical protein
MYGVAGTSQRYDRPSLRSSHRHCLKDAISHHPQLPLAAPYPLGVILEGRGPRPLSSSLFLASHAVLV